MLKADHHTHLLSPAAAERVGSYREISPSTASDLVAVLDADGVESAIVLSVAYFYGMPDLGKPNLAAMAAENDWVAGQVAAHPDRLVGCCSVNPLLDGAVDEIERCVATGGFRGVKLHLANSDVDLRDDANLGAVGDVFECANANGLGLVVHMRTRRPDYGAEDAARFIESVLTRAPNVPIQVAHLAGWGGYDEGNDAAFATFADWLAEGQARQVGIYFDIAVAPLDYEPPALDGGTSGAEEHVERWHVHRFAHLTDRVRAVGLERILFGTDWPVVTPAAYLHDLGERIALDLEELERVCSNRHPWLTTPKETSAR